MEQGVGLRVSRAALSSSKGLLCRGSSDWLGRSDADLVGEKRAREQY